MTIKTRAGLTMTEAKYWSRIRSALRMSFRYWPPMQAYKVERRIKLPEGRQKFAYRCEICSQVFKEREIQIDHIEPLGSLKCEADLIPFLRRLSAETGYRMTCKPCHKIKTAAEKKSRA